jgi:hypothetical protein
MDNLHAERSVPQSKRRRHQHTEAVRHNSHRTERTPISTVLDEETVLTKEAAMDTITRKHVKNIESEDRDLQNQAFSYLLQETENPVEWAYEVWDRLVEGLRHKDNHVRAISAQILANLAKSDPKNRMKRDFPALMAGTKDERFVTARHNLQSIWKVGLEKKMQKTVVQALADWFRDCKTEKNWTLIRYDIIQDLRNLYDEVQHEKIKAQALELIETEENAKYKKKYASVWK